MTNEELQNKIHDTNIAVVEIKGDIKTLVTLVDSHVKATEKIEKRVDGIEKRIWSALFSAVVGLLSTVYQWTVKR